MICALEIKIAQYSISFKRLYELKTLFFIFHYFRLKNFTHTYQFTHTYILLSNILLSFSSSHYLELSLAHFNFSYNCIPRRQHCLLQKIQRLAQFLDACLTWKYRLANDFSNVM